MVKRAAVAMSGGIDSSVCAYLMKESGFDCTGITMKLFQNKDILIEEDNSCLASKDAKDAENVAAFLGIPHYTFDLKEPFFSSVIDSFVSDYKRGATPNPCINCNKHLKFGALFDKTLELGCSYLATGHYANVEFCEESGRYLLKKALDSNKDQSYFLYSLSQEVLSKTKFPLGNMSKSEVRLLAEKNGFANSKKSDSQDICFIPDGDYASFIERYTKENFPEGNFVDKEGNILGRHKGIIRYTIGQRKGLGIAYSHPLYVLSINPCDNSITLSSEEELFSDTLFADNINLISVEKIKEPLRVKARIRYRHKEQDATVFQTNDDEIKVVFDHPQRAITKGQAVVLYDKDVVVGGGTIK